jgi:hypothetical protein
MIGPNYQGQVTEANSQTAEVLGIESRATRGAASSRFDFRHLALPRLCKAAP